jgi:hypothetical protein
VPAKRRDACGHDLLDVQDGDVIVCRSNGQAAGIVTLHTTAKLAKSLTPPWLKV